MLRRWPPRPGARFLCLSRKIGVGSRTAEKQTAPDGLLPSGQGQTTRGSLIPMLWKYDSGEISEHVLVLALIRMLGFRN